MYELDLGFQTKKQNLTTTKKIFYNLNPDVNKKKHVDADDKKKTLTTKKNVSLRYVMAKKHVTKKNIAFSPAPPATKKNVTLCCVVYTKCFEKKMLMSMNVNAYNTKTIPSTHLIRSTYDRIS